MALPRVKLLALHGRYQNAQICVERLAGMRIPRGPAAACPAGAAAASAPAGPGAGELPPAQVAGYGAAAAPSARIWLPSAGPADPCGPIQLDLVALDAPHVVEPKVSLGSNASLRRKTRDPSSLGPACQTRAWWFKDGDDAHRGLDESLAAVEAIVREHARGDDPFDGVVGFSQGASLASLLCEAPRAHALGLRFAVFCSGYAFSDALVAAADLRSLHVFSPLDRMVDAAKSAALAQLMRGEARPHESGHHLPAEFLHRELHSFLCVPAP